MPQQSLTWPENTSSQIIGRYKVKKQQFGQTVQITLFEGQIESELTRFDANKPSLHRKLACTTIVQKVKVEAGRALYMFG